MCVPLPNQLAARGREEMLLVLRDQRWFSQLRFQKRGCLRSGNTVASHAGVFREARLRLRGRLAIQQPNGTTADHSGNSFQQCFESKPQQPCGLLVPPRLVVSKCVQKFCCCLPIFVMHQSQATIVFLLSHTQNLTPSPL